MTRRWLRILSFAALAPLAVDVPGDRPGQSSTNVSIAFGAGSYAAVSRGCNGNVINKDIRYFRDTGFAVEHKTKGPLVLGVKETALRRMPGYPEDAVLLNPHVALEGRVVGIGAGYITGIAEEGPGRVEDYEIWPVSAHLRFGTLTGPVHFSIHSLEDLPLVSGGSTVRVGFGLRPGSGVNGWVGLSSGIPYDRLGLVVKTDVNLHRNFTLNLAGRLGSTEGLDENAAAAGLTIRFPHGSGPKTD